MLIPSFKYNQSKNKKNKNIIGCQIFSNLVLLKLHVPLLADSDIQMQITIEFKNKNVSRRLSQHKMSLTDIHMML